MKNILYSGYMVAGDSPETPAAGGHSNHVRPSWTSSGAPPWPPGGTGPAPAGTGDLDDIDRHIVRELARDARLANNALADRVGIAPSTCLGRVRSLRERGVIRGYHADVDPAALGRALQALIAIRLESHARSGIRGWAAGAAKMPEVLNVFFIAGKDDFLLHVAAASTAALRDFVETLSRDENVAYTETSLIFEHLRADAAG
jgi:DNA-binding Lrp family transcriptional regulator